MAIDPTAAEFHAVAVSSASAAWSAVWAAWFAGLASTVVAVTALTSDWRRERLQARSLRTAAAAAIAKALSALEKAHTVIADKIDLPSHRRVQDRRAAVERARAVLDVIIRRDLDEKEISVLVAIGWQLDAAKNALTQIDGALLGAHAWAPEFKRWHETAVDAARELA